MGPILFCYSDFRPVSKKLILYNNSSSKDLYCITTNDSEGTRYLINMIRRDMKKPLSCRFL